MGCGNRPGAQLGENLPARQYRDCSGGMFAGTQTLRTPEERLAGVPEFPYAPRNCEIADGEGGGYGWLGWKTDRPMGIRC
jgi:hypothetical protein